MKHTRGKPYDPNDPKTWTVRNPNADPNNPRSRTVPNPARAGKPDPVTGVRTTPKPVRDGRPAGSVGNQVKSRQRELLKVGYVIGKEDGVWGPRSQAAWRNYVSAKKQNVDFEDAADFWNDHSKYGVNRKPQPAATPVGNPGDGAVPSAPADAPAEETSTDATMKALMAIIGGQPGDPRKIGAAMTEQQFGSPIRNQRHELAQEQRQGDHDVSKVQGWFENLIAQNKEGDTADASAMERILGDNSGLLKNVLGSLGDESARAQVGRTALFNEGALKGLGAAEGNFNRNRNTDLALTGREEASRYENESRGRQDDIRSKLEGLIHDKSNALMTNTQAATDSILRRKGESINQFVTMAQLPAALEGAGLENIMKELQIDSAQNAPVPGQFIPWQKLSVQDKKAQFDTALQGSGAFGPGGNLMSNPAKAAEKIRIAMNQSGYSVKKNPMLGTWIRTAVNNALKRSQAAGQWTDAKGI